MSPVDSIKQLPFTETVLEDMPDIGATHYLCCRSEYKAICGKVCKSDIKAPASSAVTCGDCVEIDERSDKPARWMRCEPGKCLVDEGKNEQ